MFTFGPSQWARRCGLLAVGTAGLCALLALVFLFVPASWYWPALYSSLSAVPPVRPLLERFDLPVALTHRAWEVVSLAPELGIFPSPRRIEANMAVASVGGRSQSPPEQLLDNVAQGYEDLDRELSQPRPDLERAALAAATIARAVQNYMSPLEAPAVLGDESGRTRLHLQTVLGLRYLSPWGGPGLPSGGLDREFLGRAEQDPCHTQPVRDTDTTFRPRITGDEVRAFVAGSRAGPNADVSLQFALLAPPSRLSADLSDADPWVQATVRVTATLWLAAARDAYCSQLERIATIKNPLERDPFTRDQFELLSKGLAAQRQDNLDCAIAYMRRAVVEGPDRGDDCSPDLPEPLRLRPAVDPWLLHDSLARAYIAAAGKDPAWLERGLSFYKSLGPPDSLGVHRAGVYLALGLLERARGDLDTALNDFEHSQEATSWRVAPDAAGHIARIATTIRHFDPTTAIDAYTTVLRGRPRTAAALRAANAIGVLNRLRRDLVQQPVAVFLLLFGLALLLHSNRLVLMVLRSRGAFNNYHISMMPGFLDRLGVAMVLLALIAFTRSTELRMTISGVVLSRLAIFTLGVMGVAAAYRWILRQRMRENSSQWVQLINAGEIAGATFYALVLVVMVVVADDATLGRVFFPSTEAFRDVESMGWGDAATATIAVAGMGAAAVTWGRVVARRLVAFSQMRAAEQGRWCQLRTAAGTARRELGWVAVSGRSVFSTAIVLGMFVWLVFVAAPGTEEALRPGTSLHDVLSRPTGWTGGVLLVLGGMTVMALSLYFVPLVRSRFGEGRGWVLAAAALGAPPVESSPNLSSTLYGVDEILVRHTPYRLTAALVGSSTAIQDELASLQFSGDTPPGTRECVFDDVYRAAQSFARQDIDMIGTSAPPLTGEGSVTVAVRVGSATGGLILRCCIRPLCRLVPALPHVNNGSATVRRLFPIGRRGQPGADDNERPQNTCSPQDPWMHYLHNYEGTIGLLLCDDRGPAVLLVLAPRREQLAVTLAEAFAIRRLALQLAKHLRVVAGYAAEASERDRALRDAERMAGSALRTLDREVRPLLNQLRADPRGPKSDQLVSQIQTETTRAMNSLAGIIRTGPLQGAFVDTVFDFIRALAGTRDATAIPRVPFFRRVHLHREPSPDLPPPANHTRTQIETGLLQVLCTALSNVKHHGTASQIIISVTTEDDVCQLEVWDDGAEPTRCAAHRECQEDLQLAARPLRTHKPLINVRAESGIPEDDPSWIPLGGLRAQFTVQRCTITNLPIGWTPAWKSERCIKIASVPSGAWEELPLAVRHATELAVEEIRRKLDAIDEQMTSVSGSSTPTGIIASAQVLRGLVEDLYLDVRDAYHHEGGVLR